MRQIQEYNITQINLIFSLANVLVGLSNMARY